MLAVYDPLVQFEQNIETKQPAVDMRRGILIQFSL